MIFKVLVFQALYNSPTIRRNTSFAIGAPSFMRFVGLALEDAVPDGKTLLYREALAKSDAEEELFDRFDRGFAKSSASSCPALRC